MFTVEENENKALSTQRKKLENEKRKWKTFTSHWQAFGLKSDIGKLRFRDNNNKSKTNLRSPKENKIAFKFTFVKRVSKNDLSPSERTVRHRDTVRQGSQELCWKTRDLKFNDFRL